MHDVYLVYGLQQENRYPLFIQIAGVYCLKMGSWHVEYCTVMRDNF